MTRSRSHSWCTSEVGRQAQFSGSRASPPGKMVSQPRGRERTHSQEAEKGLFFLRAFMVSQFPACHELCITGGVRAEGYSAWKT